MKIQGLCQSYNTSVWDRMVSSELRLGMTNECPNKETKRNKKLLIH